MADRGDEAIVFWLYSADRKQGDHYSEPPREA